MAVNADCSLLDLSKLAGVIRRPRCKIARRPTNDSSNQLDAVWHAYFTPSQYLTAARAIKTAGYPVIITEYGDQNGQQHRLLGSIPFCRCQQHQLCRLDLGCVAGGTTTPSF
jgi:hypothetical protein